MGPAPNISTVFIGVYKYEVEVGPTLVQPRLSRSSGRSRKWGFQAPFEYF